MSIAIVSMVIKRRKKEGKENSAGDQVILIITVKKSCNYFTVDAE